MEYNSSVSDVDEVTKRVSVTVPKAQVSEQVDSELNRLQRSVSIKGFRPGKAPKQMIERLHGSRVRMEVASKLIQESLGQVIEKESLDVIGNPEIDTTEWDEDGNFQFTAQLSLFPAPAISDYKGLSVEVEKPSVENKHVDQALEEYRKIASDTEAGCWSRSRGKG